MNAKQMIAAAAILAATAPAFAAEWVDFSDFVSTKSRAEVIAELRQAQADGSYAAAQSEFAPVAPVASARSRSEVRAEAIESAKNRADVNTTYFGG